MKKLLAALLIGTSLTGFCSTLLTNYQGAWESTVSYRVRTIYNINAKSVPEVTYSNGLYIANGESQPTKGLIPESDAAWDQVN